jgi:hypothetical protein
MTGGNGSLSVPSKDNLTWSLGASGLLDHRIRPPIRPEAPERDERPAAMRLSRRRSADLACRRTLALHDHRWATPARCADAATCAGGGGDALPAAADARLKEGGPPLSAGTSWRGRVLRLPPRADRRRSEQDRAAPDPGLRLTVELSDCGRFLPHPQRSAAPGAGVLAHVEGADAETQQRPAPRQTPVDVIDDAGVDAPRLRRDRAERSSATEDDESLPRHLRVVADAIAQLSDPSV